MSDIAERCATSALLWGKQLESFKSIDWQSIPMQHWQRLEFQR